MRTVVETPTFAKLAENYRDEAKRLAFVSRLAADPEVGTVVKGTGGVRKVRWTRPGKSANGNIPAHVLASIRQEIER